MERVVFVVGREDVAVVDFVGVAVFVGVLADLTLVLLGVLVAVVLEVPACVRVGVRELVVEVVFAVREVAEVFVAADDAGVLLVVVVVGFFVGFALVGVEDAEVDFETSDNLEAELFRTGVDLLELV